MNSNIYTCLWFDGNAKEAATFYCDIFTNSKITANTPMVVTFELSNKKFMGLNGGPMFKINPSISFVVTCKTIDETNKTWNSLIDGGKAMMAIDKYPWSERYGWLQDKFGTTWQVSIVNKEDDDPGITPCMLFTGNNFGKGEEAMNFYISLFPNSSKGMVVHYPEQDANAGKLMYAQFTLNGFDMIVMDGPGEHAFTFNEAVSIVVNCKTQEEIDLYWNELSKEGEESRCGWLKDKYGVSWQIVPEVLSSLMQDPARSQRVMQAFMQMKKFDIETLQKA